MNNFEYRFEEELNKDIFDLLKANQPFIVSGTPLRVFHPTDSSLDKFFTDCDQLEEELLCPPFRVFKQYFGSSDYNLPEIFLPEENEHSYFALQGFTIDGYEVVLGIKKSLGFDVKTLED